MAMNSDLTIMHVMLAKGYGGIESAYIRYTEALLALGYKVVCITHPEAAVKNKLPLGAIWQPLAQKGQWDVGAMWRARRILRDMEAALLITHGNRASRIMRVASWGICKQMVVLHRSRMRGLWLYNRIITVSETLRQKVIASGFRAERVIHIPNFLTQPSQQISQSPHVDLAIPVIGFLGRFVPEKGADLLIEALKILKEQGFVFKAIIGGDGQERTYLESLIDAVELRQYVTLAGWIEDAERFFSQVDVLCVPSRVESFGLVILEAWRAGVFVVATRTDGPASLIEDGISGVLCDISAESIAQGLAHVLAEPAIYKDFMPRARDALEPYMMASILPLLRSSVEEMLI